ncbi:MAG: hypothetical protein ACOYW3_10675 [Bacteroidota bacterium]
MKLTDAIILSLSVVFIIIGIYETMKWGIGHSYWSLMMATLLFFYFNYRKRTRSNSQNK